MPIKKKSTKTQNLISTVEEISFNVDDMTGEEISYALDKISEAGAKEVYTAPIFMKKNRPGILFTVIVSEDKQDEVLQAIFTHTSTTGVRSVSKTAYKMTREISKEKTALGTVRKKKASGYKAVKEKYEFEDLKKLAEDNNLSIKEVLKALEKNR